ncbi:MAG: succinate dehydrogenase cytochrome b subunit [Chlorobi bacterium]|nr:succinate dehydrogenase cytochrome b subunit [Chlorobiota bacterium]
MSNFFNSSIGKKLIMSISGLFLIMFLLVHLTANLFLLGGSDVFNLSAHFMDSNIIIQIMQPILALGFFLHILYSLIVQFHNWKSRPVKYAKVNQKEASTWVSRNMIWLGVFVFAFLFIHIINFFWVLKFGEPGTVMVNGEEMEDAYTLVTGLFTSGGVLAYIYSGIYIIGFIALGLHLHHALWSAFQTIGWSNIKWRKILTVIGDMFAILIAVGFSIIPIYFLFIK